MKTVFLPTVRHSGTVFLLEFFKAGGFPTVNLDRTLFAGDHIPHHTAAVIHTHVDVNVPEVKVLHGRSPKVAHELAINYYETFNFAMMDALAGILPTVIPMRCPLLSVITRHARHPEQAPHTYLISSWHRLAKAEWDAYFVPVDQHRTKAERVTLLMGMLRHCGIPVWAHAPGYAENWKPVNAVSGLPDARAAHARKDLRWFERHFPEETEVLRTLEPDIRPLFQSHGYKDLLWFRDTTSG